MEQHMSTPDPVVISGLNKIFNQGKPGQVDALVDIDLTVAQGEFVHADDGCDLGDPRAHRAEPDHADPGGIHAPDRRLVAMSSEIERANAVLVEKGYSAARLVVIKGLGEGKALLVISSELPELIGLCRRIRHVIRTDNESHIGLCEF